MADPTPVKTPSTLTFLTNTIQALAALKLKITEDNRELLTLREFKAEVERAQGKKEKK